MQSQSSIAGPLKIAVLTAVFACSGLRQAVQQSCFSNLANGDFWWHLRVGLGILQTHTIPRTGLYSQSAAQPWMASSWFYDVTVAASYDLLDLRFIPLLAVFFKLVLALFVFILAGGLRSRFWTAILLTIVAAYVLGSLQPLPIYCSVLALAIELILLMNAQRTSSLQSLYCLPLLFLLWANTDVQFVYGVIVLLMFLTAEALAQSGGNRFGQSHNLPLKQLGGIAAASVIATVVAPYGCNSYVQFFSEATSAANVYFPDHQALRFRTPQDYVLMLLAMAAFLALGRRRSRDLFQIGLLILCTLLAFRAQGDVWLLVLAAVAVLANTVPEVSSEHLPNFGGWQCATAGLTAGVILSLVTVLHLPGDRKTILAKIGEGFPVGAADYIRENGLPRPLFNSLPWGGFLTWYLPNYPVAIDGRTDLYGADFIAQYAKVMHAEQHYSTFAPLNQAATIVLERKSLIGKALPAVAGFRVAYVDDVAIVLLREVQQP